MPKTVLREFTGGLSDEIDPQNLRDDQGEEALDINLKGFALEPGEGTSPISDGGHYYYRGEWIRDSKAVSFEESGIGVIKTFDDKRPEFEEIIKDDVNISRSLGPPLAPPAVLTGTIASEGTRGQRPAEGSHLLTLPETTLGAVDKAPDADSAAQSLETYKADSTATIDDIHYYHGQAYWIEKSGSNWTVVTRAETEDGFTSSNIVSSTCTHNSGGSFFKGGYFVCWDNQFIDSVELDNKAMTGSRFDTIDTVNVSDNGDAGAQGFGSNAGGNFTSGASSTEITGVDIDGSGLISFSQRITTANTAPSAYADSADERWLRMPSGKNGCFVVFIRDGMPKSDSESNGVHGGNYTETDDAVEVWTNKNEDVFPEWITPTGKLTTDPSKNSNPGTGDRWSSPDIAADLKALGDIPYGFKYAVVMAENDTWVRIKYVGAKYPEIMVLNGARGNDDANAVSTIYATRNLRSRWRKWEKAARPKDDVFEDRVIYYQDYIDIELIFPSISTSGNKSNKIKWTYTAPTGNVGRQGFLYGWGGIRTEYSSYAWSQWSVGASWTSWVPRKWSWDISGSQVSTNGAHSYGGQAGSWDRNLYSFNASTKSSSQLGKNNITTPAVPGKMHRLCSYVRGGSVQQKGGFGVSKLWTKARITKENTIEFAEAKHVNFRVGDYIRIGQNGSNESMHLNLSGEVWTGVVRRGWVVGEQQRHINAKITGITEGVSLSITPPEIARNRHGDGNTYLDEDCYPVISSFVDSRGYNFNAPDAPGPVCSVIQSDLSSHVLVGHDKRRESYKGDTRKGEIIEVRNSSADQIEVGSEANYTHRGISWIGQDVRAVDAVAGTAPRIFYTKGTKNRKLYSQKGSGADVLASSVSLSPNGGYHVDKDYLTHFDNNDITIFTPDLLSTPYVKAKPTLEDGLGLTGSVTDARTFVDTSNAVYVCVKIGGYWKLVKTSNEGPESSLLFYDFKKPIGFDGTKIWGIGSDSTGGWDIQHARPFYESNILDSWIFYADDYTTTTPTVSAWGRVINSRVGEKTNTGTKRYLSVDWKYDSGYGTSNPTIGKNHEVDKMVGDNTFKWYPVDMPHWAESASGTGTVIADITGNTYKPLASVEVPFVSTVKRDIVFFKETDQAMLPSSGDTGNEAKINFLTYEAPTEKFYILSDNAFKLVTQPGKEPEIAYRIEQSVVSGDAFDASRLEISSFLIGAPNMFNAYGPNIDFYYRASFVNKWGHESAPSPLPAKGIGPLDTADDCVQINFNAPFFRLDDPDIETIRLYRYGGDSSEFLHLRDIAMPTLPFTTELINGETVKIPYFPTLTGINSITNGFYRKNASSPYYIFKTANDISSLSEFVNSNFLLNATSSGSPANQLDGSWRINQLSENDPPSVAHTSLLAEKDINTTDTTVKLRDTTSWPPSGVIKIDKEYISYAGISGTDLTGCVRGVNGTNATDHKSGHITSASVTHGGDRWGTKASGESWYDDADTRACPVIFKNTDGYLSMWAHPSLGTNNQSNAGGSGHWFGWSMFNMCYELIAVGGELPKGLKEKTPYRNAIRDPMVNPPNTSGWFINPLHDLEGSGKAGVPWHTSWNNSGFARDGNRLPVVDGDLGSGTFYMQPHIVCAPQYIRRVYDLGVGVGNYAGAAEFSMQASYFRPYGINFKVNERVRFRIGGLPLAGVTGPTNISGPFQPNLISNDVEQTSSSGSGYRAEFTIATDAISNITVTVTNPYDSNPNEKNSYNYKVGDTIIITDPGNTTNTATLTVSSVHGTAAALPTGFTEDTDYWVHSVTEASSGGNNGPIWTDHDGKVRLKSSLSSNTALSFTGTSPFGSNASIGTIGSYAAPANEIPYIHLYSANTVEEGSNFYGRYTVTNTGTTSSNGLSGTVDEIAIINPGEGHTELPSQFLFSAMRDESYGLDPVVTYTHDNGVSSSTVEWEMEMEHRNQDSTTLETAIDTALSASSNTGTIKVKDTSLFQAASHNTPKKLLIGSEVFTYEGMTGTTFTGVTGGVDSTTPSKHGLGVLVLSYDEVYATATVTNASMEIEGFGYRDKSRTPISSLYSMQTDNWPPLGLEYNDEKKQFFETESKDDYFRYIKAVGSMYFGALDSDLRFSKYGTPEYWPLDAVITLDSEIRYIEEYAGEGIVFTTNSVYRVRGTDPRAMIAFRVPDARGLPSGYEHTVSNFNGGLIWLTASDGICMYFAGKVTYLTRDKHNIGRLKKPYSCVVDGIYWLFQEPGSGTGFRLELATGEMRLARTSIEAYYAYFAKALGVGVVVTKDDIINPDRDSEFLVEEVGGDKANSIEWRSKKIDVGEPAIPKALGSIAIVYEALNSSSAETLKDGIRGQALTADLLGLDPDDLNAGDIAAAESQTTTDLYSIFTKYDEPNQTFVVDTDGVNLTNLDRRTILIPLDFDISTVTVGDRVWNELLADNTVVESVGTQSESFNSVVVGTELGITSYSIQNDTGDNGTGGYHGNWRANGNAGSADSIDISSFDSSGGLRVNLVDTLGFLSGSNPSGGLPDNDKIIFWGDNLPSNLVAGTVYYVKQTSDATKINLRTASGGNAIAYVDSGSGTNYCSTTFIEATGGSGSGFIATYGISSANGIIYSVNIVSSGLYTTLPTSFTATCPGTTFHHTGYSGYPACSTANITFSLGKLDLIFTDTNNTMADGDLIQFTTSGTLPGNITANTNYYVNERTATTFKVEAVVGGGNIQHSTTNIFESFLGSGVFYGKPTNPGIVLDKEPLKSGTGTIYWGKLPLVEIYLNEDDTPSRSFTLPPGDTVDPQSMDLYLEDLKRFRTISVAIQGDVRVQALSIRHYPLGSYQAQSLHHSADVVYKGDIDFRIMLDGDLVYRKKLNNAGDDFKEERIYFPASSFGQRAHFMNESRSGMIESVKFNGALAA